VAFIYKYFMRRFPAVLGFVAAMILLAGCATTKVDWNSRLGQYTYDDAVGELGVPDRQTTLSDGSQVAEWLERRGGGYGTGYSPRWSRFQTYDVYEYPDRYLRLTFGPDGKLNRAGNFSR
jgi:hypothetical protein